MVLPAFVCGISFIACKELPFWKVLPLLIAIVSGLCVLQLFSEWCLPEFSLIKWSSTAEKYMILQYIFLFWVHFRLFILGFAFWLAARWQKKREVDGSYAKPY